MKKTNKTILSALLAAKLMLPTSGVEAKINTEQGIYDFTESSQPATTTEADKELQMAKAWKMVEADLVKYMINKTLEKPKYTDVSNKIDIISMSYSNLEISKDVANFTKEFQNLYKKMTTTAYTPIHEAKSVIKSRFKQISAEVGENEKFTDNKIDRIIGKDILHKITEQLDTILSKAYEKDSPLRKVVDKLYKHIISKEADGAGADISNPSANGTIRNSTEKGR